MYRIINSKTEVCGLLYDKNSLLYDYLNEKLSSIDGFLKLSIYEVSKNHYAANTMNIVLEIDSKYQVLNNLDSSMDKILQSIKEEFNNKFIILNYYVIYKQVK